MRPITYAICVPLTSVLWSLIGAAITLLAGAPPYRAGTVAVQVFLWVGLVAIFLLAPAVDWHQEAEGRHRQQVRR